ncbi:EmrB/QacA subfamily drug resistance transporter [Balneicella halophila]|uniref:EmrB/QacA subfamily drug resistance transporter n=1 Tax=Balneicella halophila TaxID=1537566 RepID=A0A7L4UMF8_BALHA|nr:MFS transporter [Balneicella halophila]PVX48853.1 EmrB/QacA subfamily drug resistance transporter [Balneicella halophila]
MAETVAANKKINTTILLVATMATHFFNPFMGSAVNIALKKIGTEFSMSAVQLSWVSMSYLLAAAVFLVPFGRLGDIWGKTKMFLYGTIFFAITTFLCAFVPNSSFLIAMRFAQGIAAAMMSATLMAYIISAFPPEKRGKVIGLNISAVYLGSSLAPMIGGFLTDALSWRSIFLINASTSTLIAILIIWKLNKELSPVVKEKFDFRGSLLYMISISLLMYGLSKLPEIKALAITVLGLIGLFVFVKIEMRTKFPVLNIRMFTKNRIFALSNLSAFINYASTFAVTFMLSLYLQYIMGLSASQAGLILVIQPVMMAAVASFSGRLSDKKNPRILAAIGMGTSSLGLFLLSFISKDSSTAFILIDLFVLGIGFGMFSSPNTNVVMRSVDKKMQGTASAMVATMRNTGMMFSMAIATLIIHWFLGTSQINIENQELFIMSTKVVFTTFTVLCLFGVYTSIVKNKQA